ncbi:MAG: 1-(5-phosphoribosyl)-5-((5-phosphoribosylamino)methylideneamino)imidazole-4-carboxamide isomerase [Phycisphaerae bacterium]|nr:1-(5-phosphoribosyl)-5-((5-phosphoribosylamino)methylideneamino)imidazole-4-carboxamide isomerase [Phycisphaerae bacterium]
MEILPAIDLLGAQVVRLSQGDYSRRKEYSSVPASVAREFIGAGAKWIHVVDLDAAHSGKCTNVNEIGMIREVARQAGSKLQLGGGARDKKTIVFMQRELADRVVVGSAALKDWQWFEGLLNDTEVPNQRLALALDARRGRLAIHGWTEELAETAIQLARRVRQSGLGAIVYTDISRDGMLTGLNVEATAELIAATDVPVIASGGAAGLEDIVRCKGIGCSGLIIGKAWYEGKVDLAEAFALAAE